MHRALTIPEILDEIFSYYHIQATDWHLDRSAKHRTLLALALACRTFQDHAIAALWRQLIGFRQPILSFLGNVVEPPNLPVTADHWDQLGWKLCQSLSREDWNRFEKYTSHVREITIGYGDFQGLSNFMAFLSVKYLPRGSQGHLFPKLQSLTWRADRTTELPFIHLFAAPPSLRTLTLDFYGTEDTLWLLSILECHLLSLTCLYLVEFDTIDLTDEYHTAFSRAMESRSCQGLESFHANVMDAPALQKLAHLPNLKELKVFIVRNSSGMVSDNQNGFSNLKTLRIYDCQIDFIVSFFRSAQMPLESIVLDACHHDPEAAQPPILVQSSLGDLISSIASQPCQTSLTELEVQYFPDSNGSDRLNSPLSITTLFAFSNLRLCHVEIREIDSAVAGPTFDLNDDALVQMAAAWPYLETLIFKHRAGFHNTSKITFNGFASLLRGCPLLKTLTLSVDATQLDYAFTAGVLNSWVQDLDLLDSIIEEPTTVALILADLFGSLEQVNTWHRDSELYQPLWDEVNSILERMREEAEGSEGSQMNT
ncbi:hypothetical protein BJ138DRAFT_1130230 [Hygrophoropsis aurantiaca]|uniref:Uncharacterized protein n=1 Tax=Hygrophoropsis aurantiaca TaxID=72124 RepID=A0ACB7ZXY5_9AGAM|nr:hypothetical protein BJ138DRAFT_1130230 [Hygrophoropsis aurantiaca]